MAVLLLGRYFTLVLHFSGQHRRTKGRSQFSSMLGTDKIFREEQCGSAYSEKPANSSSCCSQFTSCTPVRGGKQHLKTRVEREELWGRFLIDTGWAVSAARAASQLPPWTAELRISVLSLPHQQLYRRSETTACFHGKGEEQPTPQQPNGQQAKMLLKGFVFLAALLSGGQGFRQKRSHTTAASDCTFDKRLTGKSPRWPYSMRTAVVLLIIFLHECGPALELGPRGDVGSPFSGIFRLTLCLLWCCISSGSKSSYQTGHGIELRPWGKQSYKLVISIFFA